MIYYESSFYVHNWEAWTQVEHTFSIKFPVVASDMIKSIEMSENVTDGTILFAAMCYSYQYNAICTRPAQ